MIRSDVNDNKHESDQYSRTKDVILTQAVQRAQHECYSFKIDFTDDQQLSRDTSAHHRCVILACGQVSLGLRL